MKMKTKSSLVEALHLSALIVLVAGISLWARSGVRFGGTQTSMVSMQPDKIIGIEVPLLAAVFAAAACGLSVVVQRRVQPVKA